MIQGTGKQHMREQLVDKKEWSQNISNKADSNRLNSKRNDDELIFNFFVSQILLLWV